MKDEDRDFVKTIVANTAAVLLAILGGGVVQDYRAGERVDAVQAHVGRQVADMREDVSTVQNQNEAILRSIGLLLDEKLAKTAKTTEHNEALNQAILETAARNRSLNEEIIRRLETLEGKRERKPAE